MLLRRNLAISMLISLAACGSGSEDGVGGVSASEARALNEAAAELDARTGAAQADAPGLNPAATQAAAADRRRVAPAGPPPADNAQ